MVSGIGGPGGGGGGGKVGGPGAPAPSPAPSSTTKIEPSTGKSFSEAVRGEGIDRAKGTEAAAGPSPLERLRKGEIDLKAYVDIRVEQATAHLDGVLARADLEKMRAELKDVIEQDPDVAALVKAAEVGR